MLHLPLPGRSSRLMVSVLTRQDFSEDMPWLAMPEKAYAEKQKLGESFRVEQCPMFVIIDPEGNVVTTEGTEIVHKDPDGNLLVRFGGNPCGQAMPCGSELGA